MLSAGMFASRAARTADRRRALWSGSPPPERAATVTSRISLVKSAPLLAPIASFLRLIFVHRLWPDIAAPVRNRHTSYDHRAVDRSVYRSALCLPFCSLGRPAWSAARLAADPCSRGTRRHGLVALETSASGAMAVPAGKTRELHRDGGQRDEPECRWRVVGQPTAEQALGRCPQDRSIGRHHGVDGGIE